MFRRRLVDQRSGPHVIAICGPSPTSPDFDDNRTAPAQATIVGVWAPDASPCTARNFREGFLPTIINTDGAWAGDTFCIFRNQKRTEKGWGVIANCSNSRERWTAQVRLSVKGDRLTWASKRGVQVYTTASRRRKTESAIAASIRCMSCSEEGGPRSQPRANASQAGFAREPCSIPLDCSCWNRAGLDARH